VTEHRSGLRIRRQGASEVSDDLVVGTTATVGPAAVDERAGHRRVEDAVISVRPE
jgi:hypothetical protein